VFTAAFQEIERCLLFREVGSLPALLQGRV